MKMSAIAAIGRRSEEGAWVSPIPGLPGVRLKVRALRNTHHERLEETLVRKRPGGSRRPLTAEERAGILDTCLAEAIILDWDGLEQEDGAPLPFSVDAVKEVLADPFCGPFRDGVIFAASNVGELGQPEG